MKLYGYWRSSSTYRVRILLHLKGLSYESIAVPLLEGAQRSKEFAAKSPLSQVPVLELDDGFRVSQSVAIAELLEELYPEPALYPKDERLRARARELIEMVNSGIQPLQNLAVLKRIEAGGMDRSAWCQDLIGRGLLAVEARLAETAGRHALGDEVGVVDAFLIPQIYAARRFEIRLDDLEHLLRVETSGAALAPFVAAHPDRQPDAPPAI